MRFTLAPKQWYVSPPPAALHHSLKLPPNEFNMAKTTTTAPAQLDPLFSRPVILDSSRHRSLKYNPRAGYGFAAKLSATPITYAEFARAACDYPIVFAGPQATPVALLGLGNGRNLLVDEAGNWRPQRYIPVNLQRYPFLFMEDKQNGQFILGADEAAAHFRPADNAEALFVDGETTALVEKVADYLTQFHGDLETTQVFTQGLLDSGLLIERRADIRLNGGEQLTLDKFRIIDEAAFNALPGETIAAWHKKNWLPLVYFHLQSLGNWDRLVDWASD